MESRNGLVVDTSLTNATGTAEREAAIAMVEDLPDDGRITLGSDKGYDTQDFVAEMRRLGVTPHVTQNNKKRRSAIDGRTTRYADYATILRMRKRVEPIDSPDIEEVFGWMFTFVAAVYNLARRSHARTLPRGMIVPPPGGKTGRNTCPYPGPATGTTAQKLPVRFSAPC